MLSALSFLDMLLQFRTGYVDKNSKIVINPKKVRRVQNEVEHLVTGSVALQYQVAWMPMPMPMPCPSRSSVILGFSVSP